MALFGRNKGKKGAGGKRKGAARSELDHEGVEEAAFVYDEGEYAPDENDPYADIGDDFPPRMPPEERSRMGAADADVDLDDYGGGDDNPFAGLTGGDEDDDLGDMDEFDVDDLMVDDDDDDRGGGKKKPGFFKRLLGGGKKEEAEPAFDFTDLGDFDDLGPPDEDDRAPPPLSASRDPGGRPAAAAAPMRAGPAAQDDDDPFADFDPDMDDFGADPFDGEDDDDEAEKGSGKTRSLVLASLAVLLLGSLVAAWAFIAGPLAPDSAMVPDQMLAEQRERGAIPPIPEADPDTGAGSVMPDVMESEPMMSADAEPIPEPRADATGEPDPPAPDPVLAEGPTAAPDPVLEGQSQRDADRAAWLGEGTPEATADPTADPAAQAGDDPALAAASPEDPPLPEPDLPSGPSTAPTEVVTQEGVDTPLEDPTQTESGGSAQTMLRRPPGELIPVGLPVPPPALPTLPLEEGFRPGQMPRYALLPQPSRWGPAAPLPPAPRTEMLRQSRFGDLPVIGPNNAIPWRVYARPFEGDASLPRVGVIITGLGQRSEPTEAAIGGMPPDVTLAFDPYARDLAVWMGRARQGGHETLLELPVEGRSFPAEDPGPLALMSMLPEIENKRRLEVVMSRAGGYVGLLATEGGQFTDNPALMRPILQDMKTRGLMYVHQGAANAVNTNGDVLPAVASVTLPLDSEPFTRAVDERLSYVESVARAQGFAVIITEATPLTLYRLSRWLDTLPEKGLVLAPASALVLSPSG